MSPVATAPAAIDRPGAIGAAVILSVISALATVPFFFLPGYDEVPVGVVVFSVVGAALTLLGAWGLWNLRRWAAILVFVLTLLGTLSALPGLGDPPSGWILAALLVMIPLGIAIMVLIVLPSSRRVYR